MMKKQASRGLALLLACLMALGSMPAGAQAQEAFSQESLDALALSLYGGELPTAGSTVIIGALKHILDSGGGYVEGKGWDTLWGWIFGSDDTNRQIIEALDRIEGKIDEILRQLGNLKNVLKERSLEDRLTKKLEEMDRANTKLKQAISEFERGADWEQKMKALDLWFEFAPYGYRNAFDFFSNYCDRVAGTTEYEKTSFFSFYDQIADLKWTFDHEGAAFRQMQRDADVHFVARMAAVLSLWLHRETQDGGGYVSKYTPEQLDFFQRTLNEGLEKVIAAYEMHPVAVRSDVVGFHVYSGEQRIAFDIYVGDPMPGRAAPMVNMHKTLAATLTDGKTMEEAEAGMRDLLAETRPVTDLQGEHFSLITKGGIAALEMAAKNKGTTIKELLIAGGFPSGDWRFGLYSSAEREDAPMRFGEARHQDIGVYTRRVDISNVDLEGMGRDLEARTLVGTVRVRGVKAPDDSHFGEAYPRGLYYPAVYEDMRMISRIMDTGYLPIWVANGQNVPVVEDIPAVEADGPMEALVQVDSAAEGVLAGTCVALEGLPIRFFTDSGTALPENTALGDLPGKTVMVAYEVASESPQADGMPSLRAVRIGWADPADDTGKRLEGTVVRIESAAQIIGGTEDLVVEAEGRQHIFDLTAATRMDEGVVPGVTVRVAYQEGAEGLNHADVVTVTGMGPAPTPEVAEGIIIRLSPGAMPGSQGSLSLGIPGGALELGLPADVPVDALQEGMPVRVTYYTQEGVHTAIQIDILGNPAPDDGVLVAEGLVTGLDVALEIVGQAPRVVLAVPGGELSLSVPYGLPEGLAVGAQVHVHYHVADGSSIADDIAVITPPAPDPVEPEPVGPTPGPIDPVDPDPVPVQAWVEGYILEVLEDPALLLPGQLREVTVSAAGQVYRLQVPDAMGLSGDVQVGAFVHIDYTAQPDGQGIISAVHVLEPAPQPVDDPMPGPLEEPMPGPLGVKKPHGFSPIGRTGRNSA